MTTKQPENNFVTELSEEELNCDCDFDRCLPKEEIVFDLADLFKLFSDSTRLKILLTLEQGELCVNDLAKFLCSSQSAISHQLRILRNSKLVKARRKGKNIYYLLDDFHVNTILNLALEHLGENKEKE